MSLDSIKNSLKSAIQNIEAGVAHAAKVTLEHLHADFDALFGKAHEEAARIVGEAEVKAKELVAKAESEAHEIVARAEDVMRGAQTQTAAAKTEPVKPA